MKKNTPHGKRGRPRAFDADKALGAAMRVFWKRGYEGASLPELTRAMGINRPSMYAAFGNKEALFRKALDRYMEEGGALLRDAMAEPTSRRAVERLLTSIVRKLSTGQIRGCLLVQGALACRDSSDPIRKALAARRAATERTLRERFERGIAEGDLPRKADPAALAKFVATLQNGIAVQMAGGADRETMLSAIDVALRGWPK